MRRSLKVKRTALLPIVVVVAWSFACKKPSDPAMKMTGMPPTPVAVAKAEQKSIPVQLRQIGAVEPITTIAVKAQIGGELNKVFFKEGQDVKKGAELFEIDPRPYQQALDQAQAALNKDTALVAQSQANLAKDRAQTDSAKVLADRYAALLKEGIASKEQSQGFQTTLDTQQQSVRADEAGLVSARAAVESDRAAIETAKLNLSYCIIRSPIDGRAGSLLVQAGNLVKANDTNSLVNINQLSPIYVTFSVPQQELDRIRAYNAAHPLTVEARVNGDLTPRMVSGQLSFIDNTVDATTGTIKLKAFFPNTDHALWPGQFINVVLTLKTLPNAIVVPSETIQSGQQGLFAFVVKANNTAEIRMVKTGETVDKMTVVESGIAPGETVVTDGQLRLFPGAPVRISAPPPPAARPANSGAM
jgi:multidrug efflux system membrane fusion protein